ncbi:MAG: hypothetical protein H6624_03240 [Bdellovibrionaceae bacterium]|nr:hypothetical protein [Bdellovibrionales bacterium]MCB9083329.1 hypothetical protein [Pseudobdellovibrionaceae bacterium]
MRAFKILVLLCAVAAFIGCGRTDRKNPKDKNLQPPGGEHAKVVLQPTAALLGENAQDGFEVILPVGDQTQSISYKGRWDGGNEPVAFANPGNESEKISFYAMGNDLEVLVAVSYPNWDLSNSNDGMAYVFTRMKDQEEKYTGQYKLSFREKETSAAFVITLIEAHMEAQGMTPEQAVADIAKSKSNEQPAQ